MRGPAMRAFSVCPACCSVHASAAPCPACTGAPDPLADGRPLPTGEPTRPRRLGFIGVALGVAALGGGLLLVLGLMLS